MTDTLRVNNNEFSIASCQFKADGVPYEGINSIKYSQTRKRKKVRGMNRTRKPISRTRGNYEPGPVTVKMLTSSFSRLTGQLTAKGLGSYGSAEWTGILTIAEPGMVPQVTILKDLCIDEDSFDASDSDDPLYTEFTCDVMDITVNGKVLYTRGPK